MTITNVDIGRRLELKLQELGWSQVDLCRALNKTESWLSKILDGERGMNAKTIFEIARVLKISVDELSPYYQTKAASRPGMVAEATDAEVAGQLYKVIPPEMLDRLIRIRRSGKKK